MNVVDSSAWLEYFADGPNAETFAPAIEDTPNLVVPAICLYEVFKRVFQQRDEAAAMEAAALMMQGRVVAVDASLASAARVSIDCKLPLADSLILATARVHGATVWTQDADFQNLPDVRFVAKVAQS